MLLEQKLAMHELPFFSGGDDPNGADIKKYWALLDSIEKASRKLKRGDKVKFIWTVGIKDRGDRRASRLKFDILEGTIKSPVKTYKTIRWGEESSREGIKVSCNGYVYEITPENIEICK